MPGSIMATGSVVLMPLSAGSGVVDMGKKLRGRGAVPGIAEGRALVCPDSIQGLAGVDAKTGVIIEKGHVEEGQSIDGRILVLPASKGSNCWSSQFNSAMFNGIKPAGWIVRRLDARVGVAAVMVGSPMVADFNDVDPCVEIQTGDLVLINGETGEVTIEGCR